MKKLLIFAALLLAAVSCGQKTPKMKVLVLYYSQTGTTKAVAEEICNRLGADIEAIEAVNPYDGDFGATIARCQQEMAEGVLPELKPLQSDVASYDVIFLGYPIWFGTYAPPVATLLKDTLLAQKKIVPFCCFGSGGLESSVANLAKALPDAEILPGYGVRAARIDAMPAEIDRFLKEGGFIEGEIAPLEAFDEEHSAAEAEAAIFDSAVAGYPMLNAKAEAVASRPVPGGIEYRFIARDLPREIPADFKTPKGPNPPKGDKAPKALPPAGPLTVFVLALDGQAPVFTRVIR